MLFPKRQVGIEFVCYAFPCATGFCEQPAPPGSQNLGVWIWMERGSLEIRRCPCRDLQCPYCQARVAVCFSPWHRSRSNPPRYKYGLTVLYPPRTAGSRSLFRVCRHPARRLFYLQVGQFIRHNPCTPGTPSRPRRGTTSGSMTAPQVRARSRNGTRRPRRDVSQGQVPVR